MPARTRVQSISQQTWFERLERHGLREDVQRIADLFGINLASLATDARTKRIGQARCYLYAWLRLARGWSWPEIGAFCNRDHATCLMGSRTRFRSVRAPLVREAA